MSLVFSLFVISESNRWEPALPNIIGTLNYVRQSDPSGSTPYGSGVFSVSVNGNNRNGTSSNSDHSNTIINFSAGRSDSTYSNTTSLAHPSSKVQPRSQKTNYIIKY